jgi:23S rRNA (uracil1939-C5)-methyltransferase
VKRTGKAQGNPESVYRRPASPAEIWQGPVERLAWGGKGVARAEDGRLILLSAPLALFPGETVKASVHWKPRHAEGQVTAWVKRDPRRARAACPVAEWCGGCDLQESGEAGPGLKRLMVEDLLRRDLPEAPPWTWLPAPAEARRHRIQLHWDGKRFGFHRRRSHDLVPVTACPAASDAFSQAIPRLAEALEARILPIRPQRWELATGTPAGDVRAATENGRAWRLEPDGWHPCGEPLTHRHRELRFDHGPGAFFQVCAPWAMEAFDRTLAAWNLEGDTLFDGYGGVGLFSGLLGTRFKRRVLVESEPTAVRWAQRNLEALGLPSECIQQDVAEWLPEGLGGPQDTILLDPPRTGLGAELSARLNSARAGTLVLVGCDGAAFCRDAKALAPRWKLEALSVLDLFPLTVHAEFVGLFRPIEARPPANLEA